MRQTYIIFVLAAILFVACSPRDEVDYVNPLIGTDYTGNTFPGVCAPFGMVQLSPDNGLPGWDRIAGYYYPDSTIAGFSHTHLQGTGAGDLYDVSFMPVMLPWREAAAPLGVHSRFSHDDEVAEAGYYCVRLSDYDIKVELTATERMGIQRYTFPAGQAAVLLNLAKSMNWDATVDSHVELIDSQTIAGSRFSTGWARDQRVYFATRFSRPFEGVVFDTVFFEKGKGLTVQFNYTPEKGDELLVETALSCVSEQHAIDHLRRHAKGDFDCYRQSLRDSWQRQLSVICVEGGSDDEKTVFYTALYHALCCPTLFCDEDSSYFGADKQVHKGDFVNYSTFSLWDTYRAAHPLYTISCPSRVKDMVSSLLAHHQQFGRLPVWTLYGGETDMMIGYHAAPVVVDAYLKGLGGASPLSALSACVTTANVDGYRGIGLYKSLGYVPYDVTDEYNADDWSLSRTLEYAFDDYCVGLLAERVGDDFLAEEFFSRSRNYRNLWHDGFFVPRDSKGNFLEPFSPTDYSKHICESNAWQYLWSVQHDVEGLMGLLGGEDQMAAKLDEMFSFATSEEGLPIFSTGMIGQYAHGNEPSHHVAYLYNAVRQPWKTERLTQRIVSELYKNAPDGLCGNEDCGQMSAWYVFSAMGFYPVNPVSGDYELTTPLFDDIRIVQENEKVFHIRVHNRSAGCNYIERVRVDGVNYPHSYITHQQIASGATIDIYLTPLEGRCWY